MPERDALGMQGLAWKLREPLLQARVLDPIEPWPAVDGVPHDRQPGGRQVHADLVGAARDQAAAKQSQSEREELPLDLVESARLPGARRQLSSRLKSLHLLAVA